MRRAIFVLLAVLVAVNAEAQTSNCSTTPNLSQVDYTINSGLTTLFVCARPADGPEAGVIYVGNIPTDLGVLQQMNQPDASGYALYTVAWQPPNTAGNYTVTFSVYNHDRPGGAVQESPRSDPFALAVVEPAKPVPAKPMVKAVN